MTNEIYYSGDNTRQMSNTGANLASESVSLLVKVFPWFREADYYSISTPAFHEVLGENVITCCLPLLATDALAGPGYALGNRKFCMDTHTSFLRLYRLFDGEKPGWLPPSARVLFIGENRAEYGRAYNDKADTFHDIYFAGDEAEIEAAFGLPERRGKYETYYGATVKDGQPVRVKQYLYDEQGGFSDWDVIWMMHAKKAAKAAPSN